MSLVASRRVALSLGAVLLLAVWGCSSGEDTSATPTPTPTPSASAIPTGSATPTITATRTTVTVTPSPTGTPTAEPVFYTVQPGDTLFDIALKFNIALEALAKANGIADPTLIIVGQELFIPLDGNLVRPTPTVAPVTPTPVAPGEVNGVPVDEIVLLGDAALEKIRAIYVAGQAKGINSRAFSKVGDSTIELPHFLAGFDGDSYDLGRFAYLQDVVDQYTGSFERDSISVRRGLHAWSMFDPLWAEKDICLPNEGPVPCEIRLHRPTILLIRLGSNDVGVPDTFEENMRKMVVFSIAEGVIPVLGTKADQHEGSDVNNEIIRRLAAEYAIPLWDWERVSMTLPNRGIDSTDVDGVHLSFFTENDYTLPVAFERGHGVHNLTALIVLDTIWRLVSSTP